MEEHFSKLRKVIQSDRECRGLANVSKHVGEQSPGQKRKKSY